MRAAAFLAFAFLAAAAGPALTQTAGQPAGQAAPVSDAALAARMAREAGLADQNRRSELLNVEVNRKNAEVEARNAAARAAYATALAEHEAALAAREAEAARIRAEAEKAQADHARAMAAWEADVAACRKGDVSRCGPKG